MATIKQRIKAFMSPGQTKKKIVLYPLWKEGQEAQWALTDLSTYINEGYNINALIYGAINYKARSEKQVPLRAYTGTRDLPEPLPAGHPLVQLLDRPNTWLSFAELQEGLTTNLNIFGNAYVAFTGRDANNIPSKMYPLRPDRVTHIYQGGELRGYVYAPDGVSFRDGITLLSSDVMHVKLPNPGDEYGGMGKGLSPFSALAHSGDVDNAATAFLKMFFDQGAMPPGILKTELALDDNAVAEVQERWMSIYGNWRNWQEPAVLDRDLDYKRIGLTFDELGMDALDARNENRMAMVFGVPLILIESRPGITQSTYNNYSEARLTCWQDTIIPELEFGFGPEWAYYLRGTSGEFVMYDFSGVDALQTVRDSRSEQLRLGWDAGAVLRGEYRASLGLPVDPVSDNVYKLALTTLLVPTGVRPQSSEAGAASSEDEEQAKSLKAIPQSKQDDAFPIEGMWSAPYETPKKKGLTFEQKAALYKLIDSTAVAWEGRFQEVGREAFSEDARAIKAMVGDLKAQAYKERKTIDWSLMMTSVDGYYGDGGISQEQWAQRFRPVMAGVVTNQTTQLSAQFGIAFDVQNLLALPWFDSYTMKFVGEVSATSEQAISDLLQKAMYEGWTIPEMQEQLTILFDGWAGDLSDEQRAAWAGERLPPNRTELIARDQTLRASNAGTNQLYKEWGVRKKEWFATADSRTRDTHMAAMGQIRLMNEPFDVGGEKLMYPGDPDAPLKETIQCRCSSLPVIQEGEIVGE